MTKNGVDFNTILDELSAANLNPRILRRPKKALEITGIVADSRKISERLAFCAIKGAAYDGHDALLTQEFRCGMALIERNDLALGDTAGDAVVLVDSTRAAWAQLESFFCGHPSKKLDIIGITGTNGKTSTAWMIKGLADAASVPCAMIGTLGIYFDGQHITTSHTTPDPDVLYPQLRNLVGRGAKLVAMEVSSHSLAQGKVWPIKFAAAGFTSFSQDHLDFHGSMHEYLRAKLTLFHQLRNDSPAMFHESLLSRPEILDLMQRFPRFQSYGSGPGKTIYQVYASMSRHLGTSMVRISSSTPEDLSSFEIPMIGDVFAENFALAAILVSELLNFKMSHLQECLLSRKLSPVPGRLELVQDTSRPWRPLVYVDYAHTPDALEKAINNLARGNASVCVVFGCGGDRDKTKRPLMGSIAARMADRAIITSDNPRSEDPQTIIDEIMVGARETAELQHPQTPKVAAVIDRKEAIQLSVSTNYGRDIVLIAGKGHEDYQIVGTTKTPFMDQTVALDALRTPRTWLVFGAGISGFAAAEHLGRLGEAVYISDDRPINMPEGLRGVVSELSSDQIPWPRISTVVISPGVHPTNPVIVDALRRRIPVISEIDLGFDCFRGKLLAVTGTNGKSTTVSMTEFLGKSLGVRINACGNIGIPPTSLNLRRAPSDLTAVVELSSYQLEGSSNWPADTAAITSFSPDHLARHKTLEKYFETKWQITKWIKPEGLLLLSPDVAKFAITHRSEWPKCEVIIVGDQNQGLKLPSRFETFGISGGVGRFRGKNFNFLEYGLLGTHNHSNAAMACLMIEKIYKTKLEESLRALASYPGLPFRCEVVYSSPKFQVVNDSKSTNLESTVVALSVMKRPAILLMGGQGKGESYASLSLSAGRIKNLITFGASGQQIASDASKFINAEIFEKMGPAVLRALQLARDNNWDILFSPGCASFDEFRNFEDRGLVFNKIVRDALSD